MGRSLTAGTCGPIYIALLSVYLHEVGWVVEVLAEVTVLSRLYASGKPLQQGQQPVAPLSEL